MIRSTEIPTEQQVPRRMHCLDVRRQLPTVWTAIAFQLQVVGRFCPSLKKNVLENIKKTVAWNKWWVGESCGVEQEDELRTIS